MELNSINELLIASAQNTFETMTGLVINTKTDPAKREYIPPSEDTIRWFYRGFVFGYLLSGNPESYRFSVDEYLSGNICQNILKSASNTTEAPLSLYKKIKDIFDFFINTVSYKVEMEGMAGLDEPEGKCTYRNRKFIYTHSKNIHLTALPSEVKKALRKDLQLLQESLSSYFESDIIHITKLETITKNIINTTNSVYSILIRKDYEQILEAEEKRKKLADATAHIDKTDQESGEYFDTLVNESKKSRNLWLIFIILTTVIVVVTKIVAHFTLYSQAVDIGKELDRTLLEMLIFLPPLSLWFYLCFSNYSRATKEWLHYKRSKLIALRWVGHLEKYKEHLSNASKDELTKQMSIEIFAQADQKFTPPTLDQAEKLISILEKSKNIVSSKDPSKTV